MSSPTTKGSPHTLEDSIEVMMNMMLEMKQHQAEQFESLNAKIEDTNARITASKAGSRVPSPRSLEAALKRVEAEKAASAKASVYSSPVSGLNSSSFGLSIDTGGSRVDPAKPHVQFDTRKQNKKTKGKAGSESDTEQKSSADSNDYYLRFSDDEDSEEEPIQNPHASTEPNRRQSTLDKTVEQSMKISQPIVWTKYLPDCIARIENVTPAEVATFIQEVAKFSENYSHAPVLSGLLSNSVIATLQANKPGIEKRLGMITAKELFEVFKLILAPRSKKDFLEKLKENVFFEPCTGFTLNPEMFLAFWTKVRTYESQFSRVLDVLRGRVQRQNVPKMKDIVKIFLEKIPYNYGVSKGLELEKIEGETINKYIHRFRALTSVDLVKSQNAIDVQKSFSGTAVVAAAAVPAPPVVQSHPNPMTVLRKAPVLANVQLRPRSVCNQDSDLIQDSHSIAEEEYEDCLLRMMSAKEQSELPCFLVVQKGTCNKPSCHYSHKPEICNPARDQLIAEMSRLSTEERRARIEQQVSVARASGKYGPASDVPERRPNGPTHFSRDHSKANTVHRVRDLEQESSDIHDADLSVILAQNRLLNICPLCKAVHTTGKITLDSSVLMVDDVLFDNGALSQSYIDEAFVQRHIAKLGAIFVPDARSVNLAQKGTSAVVTGHLDLHVSFRDSQGTDVTGRQRFFVIPNLSSQMIVGLPGIVRHYMGIFLDMMRQAEAIAKKSDEMGSANLNTEPVLQLNHIAAGEIVRPWSFDYTVEAEEEKSIPEPCSFPTPLLFLGRPIEDLRKEFQEKLLARITPEFLEAVPEVEHLMRTKGQQVCVPTDWTGVRGVEPYKVAFTPDLPFQMKTAVRRVNPKILDKAKAEFERLKAHFFEPSRSAYCVGLVIAPKATDPFVRLCGDYPPLNKYMVRSSSEIPHVMHELARISDFRLYIELDMMSAFHQIPLDRETSEMLSIQTPWGQFAPKFLPEGIAVATHVLNEYMKIIFGDLPWCIAIHDNFLIMGHTYRDLYDKLEVILDRCIERNIYMKLAKCNLGIKEVSFFGYLCKAGSYCLTEERRACLSRRPKPLTKTAMASFLGAAQFFHPFVKDFAMIAAPLHEMTKKTFDWSKEPWTDERIAAMERLQEEMYNCVSNFYPDPNLTWILQTDASTVGVGCMLFQQRVAADGSVTNEPIVIASQKFTEQAARWSTHEQEAFAIVWAVNRCKYFLLGKYFIVQTDHANLRYIESSQSLKVQRWRASLSAYHFDVQHIPGASNRVADWLSRDIAAADCAPGECSDTLALLNAAHEDDALTEKLRTVHGGRNGHFGVRATYRALKELYPGNTVPYRVCEEFVACCPVCQKDRLQMSDSLKPLVLSLAPHNLRDRVGADTLTMTPVDKDGNGYITVIVVHGSKLTFLYPTKTKDAIDTARAFFAFFAIYGVFHEIQTDVGSDYTSDVIKYLTRWLGVRHRFSIVGRHQSSGVEATNREITRHLRAMVAEERILSNWSAPENIFMVQHLLNSTVSSETGKTPFELHFGSRDAPFMVLPDGVDMLPEEASDYVKNLDHNLQCLRAASKKFQEERKVERTFGATEEVQSKYATGDFVLKQRDKTQPRAAKLTMNFEGPFEVLSHDRNSVTCRHVNEGYVKVYHVTQLKPFFGSKAEAREMAKLDHDQHDVERISAFRGDPWQRTTCEFCVHFADGTVKWLTWSQDLFDSLAYEDFCRSRPALMPLLYKAEEANRRRSEINRQPIVEVVPGDVRYFDLRYFGYTWYDNLGLPDSDTTLYLVRAVIGSLTRGNKIEVHFELFDETHILSHTEVIAEAWRLAPEQGSVLMDRAFVRRYPQVLDEKRRATLLQRYQ